jgi:hypothetical protein
VSDNDFAMCMQVHVALLGAIDYLDTFGLSTGTRSLYITMSTGNEGELLCNNHASLYDMTGQACNDATRLCDATVQCV